MVQCPMIVVTDPDELILMKAKDVSFEYFTFNSNENFMKWLCNLLLIKILMNNSFFKILKWKKRSFKTLFDPGHSWSDEEFLVFPKIGKIDLEIVEAKKLMDKGKVEK